MCTIRGLKRVPVQRARIESLRYPADYEQVAQNRAYLSGIGDNRDESHLGATPGTEVAGTKGMCVVDDMWREAGLYPAGDSVKSVFTNPVSGGYRDFDNSFRERLSCFVRQVAEDADPVAIDGSGADGLEAQRVVEAVIRSLASGAVVEVATLS